MYPSILVQEEEGPIEFKIIDELVKPLEKQDVDYESTPLNHIHIHAHKLPVIADKWQTMNLDLGLNDGFEEATNALKVKLQRILI